MYCKLISMLSGLSLAACFSMAMGFALAAKDVGKSATLPDEVPTVCAYSIKDLPLWSSDGKTFEPKLLIAFAKLSVDTELHPGDEAATIRFYEPTKSLIVSATEKEHATLNELLEKLRAE